VKINENVLEYYAKLLETERFLRRKSKSTSTAFHLFV
jgi:hypothetical protein